MRSLLLAGAAALTLSSTAFAAETTTTTTNTNAGATPQFIQAQETGQVRAPKLVGVSVYDKDNKNVGKVDDLLMDKDGKITSVVIGVGGFLGIGKKDVALPYDQVHWQTEQRTAATAGTAPGAAPGSANNNLASTTAPANNGAAAPAQKTMSPDEKEAYNGYPDRAVIDFSQDQLKNAPEFKYASQTMNSDGTKSSTATQK